MPVVPVGKLPGPCLHSHFPDPIAQECLPDPYIQGAVTLTPAPSLDGAPLGVRRATRLSLQPMSWMEVAMLFDSQLESCEARQSQNSAYQKSGDLLIQNCC